MAEPRPVAPSRDSSEYAKAHRAEVAGFALAGTGALVALVALPLHDTLAGGVGCALAAVGAHLVAHVGGRYAEARARVKAAAAMPESPAVTVHAPGQRRI